MTESLELQRQWHQLQNVEKAWVAVIKLHTELFQQNSAGEHQKQASNAVDELTKHRVKMVKFARAHPDVTSPPPEF